MLLFLLINDDLTISMLQRRQTRRDRRVIRRDRRRRIIWFWFRRSRGARRHRFSQRRRAHAWTIVMEIARQLGETLVETKGTDSRRLSMLRMFLAWRVVVWGWIWSLHRKILGFWVCCCSHWSSVSATEENVCHCWSSCGDLICFFSFFSPFSVCLCSFIGALLSWLWSLFDVSEIFLYLVFSWKAKTKMITGHAGSHLWYFILNINYLLEVVIKKTLKL